MGLFLIIASLLGVLVQYQERWISGFLGVNPIMVYFALFAMLLIGIIIQIDSD